MERGREKIKHLIRKKKKNMGKGEKKERKRKLKKAVVLYVTKG